MVASCACWTLAAAPHSCAHSQGECVAVVAPSQSSHLLPSCHPSFPPSLFSGCSLVSLSPSHHAPSPLTGEFPTLHVSAVALTCLRRRGVSVRGRAALRSACTRPRSARATAPRCRTSRCSPATSGTPQRPGPAFCAHFVVVCASVGTLERRSVGAGVHQADNAACAAGASCVDLSFTRLRADSQTCPRFRCGRGRFWMRSDPTGSAWMRR
jgi:hypothetical protein